MKKYLAFILVLLMAFAFSGCKGKDSGYAQKLEGTYVADTFEIDAPENWRVNASQNNVTIFCTEDYPEDIASYISVGVTEEAQLDILDGYKGSIKAQIISSLESQLGEDCGADVIKYEKENVNGFDCMHIVTSYSAEDGNFNQDQYTFDSSKGSVTVCFNIALDEDVNEMFEKSLSSLVIK